MPRIEEGLVLVAEAVVRLLRVLANDRACLLVLEDLHWADSETLAVVEYLADNLEREPVLCLATLRSEEATAALALMRSVTMRRAANAIELRRLDELEVARMAGACLGTADVPPALCEPLQRWTEGVPLLVEELLAAWVTSGVLARMPSGDWDLTSPVEPFVPDTFAEMIRRRVDGLTPDHREVLRAAAVLGRRFQWNLLPAITGFDDRTVLGALRAGIEAQLLSEDRSGTSPGFVFRHALTRDSVLSGLLGPERAQLSRRALHAMEESHPSLPGAWGELAARLAEECGDSGRAVRLMLTSAPRALAQGALATAESTLERARRLSPNDEARLAIDELSTEVLSLAGKVDDAVEAGSRVLETYRARSAPPGRQAEVALRLARALAASGAWERAAEQVHQARGLVADAEDSSLVARLDALMAHVRLGQGHLDEAGDLARGALQAAQAALLPEVMCEALEVIGRRARLRDLHEAEAAFERARRVAEEHGLALWRIRALHELASIDVLSTVRLDRLAAARELAAHAGALATVAHLDLHISSVRAFHFEAMEALAAARRCPDTARRFRLTPLLAMARLRQAQCHALLAAPEQMEQLIAEAIAGAPGDADVEAGAWGQCRASLSLLAEQRSLALEQLEAGMVRLRGRPEALPWTFRSVWALLRTTENVGGDDARRELQASGVIAVPFHRGMAAYADAVALGRAGNHQGAADAFADAEAEMAVLAGRGGYGHLARRLVAESALRDGWGDPLSWLRESVVFFEDNGHDRVAGACRLLLRDAGAPLPRRQRSDADVPAALRALGLTARELEVLTLVAERLSNKEIGTRLFISPRTVDKHVQHLLAKVGVDRRSELIAFARTTTSDPRRQ